MKRNLQTFFYLFFAFWSFSAFAQPAGSNKIALFNFTGAIGNELSFPPDYQPNNGFVSDMSRGSGGAPASAANVFAGNGWPLASTGIDLNTYFEFTVTPDPSFALSIDSLGLGQRRSGTGPLVWEVRSSLQNFGTSLIVDSSHNTSTGSAVRHGQWALSGFQNISQAVTFRIYAYEAGASGGTFRVDSVNLIGSITSATPVSIVNFSQSNISRTEANTTFTVDLPISNPVLNTGGQIKIGVNNGALVSYGLGQTYTTNPPVINDTITLNVAAGASNVSFDVELFDNAIVEPNKIITFTIGSTPSAIQVGATSTLQLTIIEDDSTPPTPGLPLYTIGQIKGINADGVVDSNGVVCKVIGRIIGINLRTTGFQFTIVDGNDGIGAFRATNLNPNYTLLEGDLVELTGTVNTFRGLAQITFDSLVVLSNGPIPAPVVVTDLNESTESRLVRLNGLTLVTPSQWPTAGATGTGRNVDVTNGSQTFLMRIVNTSDLWGTAAPVGTFDLVGIGSQFAPTSSPPFVGGYQIFPRNQADIIVSPVSTTNQLALFTFTGSTGDNLTYPADAQPANAVVSDMSRGSGSQPTPATNVFIANNWPQGGFDANAYFEFTITPNSGFSLQLDTLRFGQRRSGSGPVTWAVRSNLDGFASNLATDSSFSSTGPLKTETIILNNFQNAISPVTFRIYAFGATATTGTFRIDNVELWGIVQAGGGSTNASISFSQGTRTLTESNAIFPISLNITNPLQNPGGIVKILATNGTGVVYGIGGDYTTNPAVINDTISVSVLAGSSSASFDLTLYDDVIPEPTKNFSFTIVDAPSGLAISAPATLAVTLLDNDSPTSGIPLYTIGQINKVNTDGIPDSTGVVCRVRGTVLGVNLRTTGYQFTIIDGNEGIGVFRSTNLASGYVVTEGDLIEIEGTVGTFRGLAQVVTDSLSVISQNNPIPAPLVVTDLNESTESRLVRLNGFTLVDPTQWPIAGTTGTGRNVDITNGSQTFLVRIVNTTDIWGTPAPTASFDIIGIGSQFAPSTQAPFVGGYQLFPRSLADIILGVTPPPTGTELALFTFFGSTGDNPTFPPDAQPINATVSDMSRGTGSTPTPANNVFIANSWSQAGFDPNAYFEFTITPASGFSLNLDTLKFDQRRSGSGPRTWAVRTSLDGFAANIASDTTSASTSALQKENIVLNGFQGTGAVTFRIYAFGATASTGTFRIDNVGLWGSVIAGGGSTNPTISFAQATRTVTESNATLPITLNIANAATNPGGLVKIRANNGAGVVYGINQDYTTNPAVVSDTITINMVAGAATASFDLTLYDDAIPEPTKNFSFTIVSVPTGVLIGNPAMQQITLLDNDSTPTNNTIPLYTIGAVRGINTDGVVDSNGVVCRLQGVVVGINLRTTGYQFTIVDAGSGIGVFRSTALSMPYTVTEGDRIEVRGTINTFRGLAQITIDSLGLIATGNTIPTPVVVTMLDEVSESRLVRINNLTLVDPTQWPIAGTSGTGRNVDVTDGVQTFTMRLLPLTNIWGTPAPTVAFDLVGIGSQFAPTTTAPFVGGYQIFPRSLNDVILLGTNVAVINQSAIKVFPNPAQNFVQIIGINEPTQVEVYTLTGQLVSQKAIMQDGILATDMLPNGIYVVRLSTKAGVITHKLAIQH